MPLEYLPLGQQAEIVEVTGQGDQAHRLHELGFRAGTLVEVLTHGSPCLLLINGQKIGFRSSDLSGVMVRLAACH